MKPKILGNSESAYNDAQLCQSLKLIFPALRHQELTRWQDSSPVALLETLDTLGSWPWLWGECLPINERQPWWAQALMAGTRSTKLIDLLSAHEPGKAIFPDSRISGKDALFVGVLFSDDHFLTRVMEMPRVPRFYVTPVRGDSRYLFMAPLTSIS